MTKEQVLQYRQKWELVSKLRIAEVRAMTPAEKIRDLDGLFVFGQQVGWRHETGEDSVCWRRLKELLNV